MFTEPAIGTAFFGRDKILGTLRKRLNALKGGYRQNIALTGQMLSGKSSIIYQFLCTLNDSSIVPVYIEVIEESFSSFADKFIATLLYNYLASCNVEAKKDLGFLLKASEGMIPHTVYAIKKVKTELTRRRYNEAYRKLLNLTSTLKKETGKSCVVIFDEFHNLEFFRIRKPYLHFGKIIMIQKDTMYIVSSSQKSTIKKILSEKLALLYGNFEIMEVMGFDNRTARAYLERKFQNITMPEDYLSYLIDFTDGNPFYLDTISRKIIEIKNAQGLSDITEDVIKDAFRALFYYTDGTINQYFINNIMKLLEKDLRKECLDVLIALASGHNKLSDLSKWFKKKNRTTFARKLSVLVDLDIVTKNGVFYEIQDKVFEFWLRSVYYRKKVSLVDDIINKADDFKKEIESDMRDFLSENKKNITDRLMDLIMRFNGETVEIEKKHKKLPRFIKAEIHEYETKRELLAYQKSDKYWVLQVRPERIEESSVSDFIERYQPIKEKVSKKICVALKGVDSNAILLAKEKNVWIWDLKRINSLMRLYRRHNLICK